MFTAVRVHKILNESELARAELHGKRMDPSAKSRVDPAFTGQNLTASDYTQNCLELCSAWRSAVKVAGASIYGKAPIALHLILVLSPEWISEAGDPRSPDNPRNQLLFEIAQAWARSVFGALAVFAARMDFDEAGAGAVDVFVVPTAKVRINRYAERTIISTNKALDTIRETYGVKYSYSALQTSWADYARENVDARIRRGKPKAETGRQHVHAEVYRKAAEEAKDKAKTTFQSAYEAEVANFDAARNEQALEREKFVVQKEKAKKAYEILSRMHDRRANADRRLQQREHDLENAEAAIYRSVALFVEGYLTVVSNKNSDQFSFEISADVTETERNELINCTAIAERFGIARALNKINERGSVTWRIGLGLNR